MSDLATSSRLYTVIGDVVRSRAFPDQRALLDRLISTLDWVEELVPARLPLRLGVGDEFQGAYQRLSEAAHAVLLTSLRLKGDVEVRFGLGWGTVDLSAAAQAPIAQVGKGWWRAREAIERVAELQGQAKGWPDGISTRFAAEDHPAEGLINAFFLCRDQVLHRMDVKDAKVATALFRGRKQQEIADDLGITQSTVSSRQRGRGPSALLRAHESLVAYEEADGEG